MEEKHQLVASHTHPNRGPNLHLRHVPWLGIKPAIFHSVGKHPTNWATLVRARSHFHETGSACHFWVGAFNYLCDTLQRSVFSSNKKTSNIWYCDCPINLGPWELQWAELCPTHVRLVAQQQTSLCCCACLLMQHKLSHSDWSTP